MQITHLSIQNFRALEDVEIPLSRFCCFIGRNNAGKSTVLQALRHFFSGAKLGETDFHDPSRPIRIALRFEEIAEHDLDRLAPDHRTKIAETVENGTLTLARCYETDGKSRLKHVKLVPTEPRFASEFISETVKGKKGGGLLQIVKDNWPEVVDQFTASAISIGDVKLAISAFADTLPPEQKKIADADLITGIDESITALLPTVIYIPGAKDLEADLKNGTSTPFGKILSTLFEMLTAELDEAREALLKATRKFSRIRHEDGTQTDERLPSVKEIEGMVQQFLSESFSGIGVEIEMPPPDIKTFFGNAQILLDDGVKGAVETKGDGLRRATVFSIFRTYARLNAGRPTEGEEANKFRDRHVLLFEEPELYLHPSAQRVLVEALRIFAGQHHVFFTTHSPSFLVHKGAATFVKVVRQENGNGRPSSKVVPVNLSSVEHKARYHLICHDNNNAAFFYETVVMVEGESDHIVLPHIGGLLVPNWDAICSHYQFIRLGGKSNFSRYRDFFKEFNVEVAFISDLDVLLDGFPKVCNDAEIKEQRDRLIGLLDEEIGNMPNPPMPKGDDYREAAKSGNNKARWRVVVEQWEQMKKGEATFDDVQAAVADFFSWEKKTARLSVLENATGDLAVLKYKILAALRNHRIFVLERGAIEAYYPTSVPRSGDKPDMAHKFCAAVTTRDDVLDLCDEILDGDGNPCGKELEVICRELFGVEEPTVEEPTLASV